MKEGKIRFPETSRSGTQIFCSQFFIQPMVAELLLFINLENSWITKAHKTLFSAFCCLTDQAVRKEEQKCVLMLNQTRLLPRYQFDSLEHFSKNIAST